MNKELKENIAVNAANEWCRCFKCDGRVNDTGCACEKDKRLTCHKWYDGYRTALLALEDDRVLGGIWKSADGDDLPIIDREVIALLNNGRVVIAHRPPEYWDGKDIITGKVTRNYVERYDKGLWNIPNVKYWLDVDLPK